MATPKMTPLVVAQLLRDGYFVVLLLFCCFVVFNQMLPGLLILYGEAPIAESYFQTWKSAVKTNDILVLKNDWISIISVKLCMIIVLSLIY